MALLLFVLLNTNSDGNKNFVYESLQRVIIIIIHHVSSRVSYKNLEADLFIYLLLFVSVDQFPCIYILMYSPSGTAPEVIRKLTQAAPVP